MAIVKYLCDMVSFLLAISKRKKWHRITVSRDEEHDVEMRK